MNISVELIALQEMQDEFEAAATDKDMNGFVKARHMRQAIENMRKILKQAFFQSAEVTHNACEYVIDFVERPDLSGEWLDKAFDDTESGGAFKSSVAMKIDDLKKMAHSRTADGILRTTLPKDDWTLD